MKNKSHLLLLLFFFFAFCKKDDKHFEDCCQGSYSWKLNDSTAIVFPNAFTPDGNVWNDLYRVLSGGITSFSFSIKKGGRTVFQTQADVLYFYSEGWDGTDGNDQAPTGKYDFEATWKVIGDPTNYSMSGTICLFRECFPSETDLSKCEFESMINLSTLSIDPNYPYESFLPACN